MLESQQGVGNKITGFGHQTHRLSVSSPSFSFWYLKENFNVLELVPVPHSQKGLGDKTKGFGHQTLKTILFTL